MHQLDVFKRVVLLLGFLDSEFALIDTADQIYDSYAIVHDLLLEIIVLVLNGKDKFTDQLSDASFKVEPLHGRRSFRHTFQDTLLEVNIFSVVSSGLFLC